ncbi:MAG: hypothetical protein HRT88_08265 [Lentisphaeraceae bacterium]|nr:hypothetical protein [Lentisphaeraceae bacterium]
MRKIFFTLTLICVGLSAAACEIPVFRYALERWAADDYTLELPASIPVNELNEDVNIEIKEGTTEVVKLYYPHRKSPFFIEPVEDFSYSALIDSPARDEIVKRILAGDSIVWVVLTTGDELPEKNILEKSLRAAEKSLGSDKVKLKFSYLQVPRNSTKERYFISCLLSIESDLLDTRETIAFPVFGRGRFLAPLVGKGINPDNIKDQGAYLAGACSCEIKSQNPGLDLLINFDWEEFLKNKSTVKDKILPSLSGIGALQRPSHKLKEDSPLEKAVKQPEDLTKSSEASDKKQQGTAIISSQSLGIILLLSLIVLMIFKKTRPHYN